MKYNEISHFSHPQHKLKIEFTEVPFKCDGCKEIGIGSCYKCNLCEYDLHMHCAIPTPVIYHPYYPKCSFIFMSRPPGNVPRYCNACERGIFGFSYHCKSCGFDLHPCCAKLPTVLDDGEITLYLYRKVSNVNFNYYFSPFFLFNLGVTFLFWDFCFFFFFEVVTFFFLAILLT